MRASLLLYRLNIAQFETTFRPGHVIEQVAPSLQLFRAVEGEEVYAYAVEPTDWLSTCSEATALEQTLDVPGVSSTEAAPWHYVVETDVLPEFEQEFNAWYEQEHLPGLAAVPGTVRATRFVNRSGNPRYHACYDLSSIETLGSPPWLAVRGTPWSSHIRPAFRNTKRTMFRRWPVDAAR